MLLYKYILTLKSINRYISILDFYIINNKELIVDVKNSVELFSVSKIKSYLTYRDSLRNLNRYNYIVYRALIDKIIKKFIV